MKSLHFFENHPITLKQVYKNKFLDNNDRSVNLIKSIQHGRLNAAHFYFTLIISVYYKHTLS
jgi:hypothetical protein